VTAAERNEPRTLARMAATTQRIAEGISVLQRLATDGGVETVLARQTIALVEEFDLLRFRLREATLRGVIEPAAAAMPARIAAPPVARKSPASAQAKGGKARAAKLTAARRMEIARKAAKARWSP
jgi:hypothetical protein